MDSSYSYRRLVAFFKNAFKPYKGRFFVATILAAIGSAVYLYNAYAFAEIVNFVVGYKAGVSLVPLYTVLALWLMALVVRWLAIFLSRYIGMAMAERAGKDVEIASIDHLSRLDISWHEKDNTGNKLKKIDRGGQTVIDGMRLWMGNIVDIAVSVGGVFIVISRIDRELSGLLLVYLAVYFFIARFTRTRAVQAMKATNIKDEEITGFSFEILSNIRTVKVLGMARKILGLAQAQIDDYAQKAKRRVFWFQIGGMLRGVWEAVGRVLLFVFIIWNILQGRYEAGFLVLFYGYFNALTTSISNLSDVVQELATYKINIGRLAEMLDEPIKIDIEEGKGSFPASWQTIVMKGVSFTYGDNSVLKGIDLEIKKGEKVGIVGLSGAGKSTLFKLFLKEYENYAGDILIGNVPLRSIKKSSYSKHIAAVLQDTEVFNMSLRQNIILANQRETDNSTLFEQALDVAHVRDFLPKLKEGTETLIGEKGVKLSGGERQRLGIARAVFKKPEVLFLDEATSHLDIESEQKIQDSLKRFFKGVTAVVIAHRLSTIKEMDRIIVIEGGKIIEEGTFDRLYDTDGRFRALWDKQKID